MYTGITTFTHWLPLVTICPVNSLPDLLYVEISVINGELRDLYKVRKQIREVAYSKGRKLYMEDVAKLLYDHFFWAHRVTVRLAFNKHVIHLERNY